MIILKHPPITTGNMHDRLQFISPSMKPCVIKNNNKHTSFILLSLHSMLWKIPNFLLLFAFFRFPLLLFPLFAMFIILTEAKFCLERKLTNLLLPYISSNKLRKSPFSFCSSWHLTGVVNILNTVEILSNMSPSWNFWFKYIFSPCLLEAVFFFLYGEL